ncbi:thioredoxin-like protein [Hypoxylon crocopeplum]|nr:thioredoxin-like protein [Hypoxylon crocopeplum]
MASIQDLLAPASQDKSVESGAEGSDGGVKETNTTPETTHFTIEFILDLICQYCYIGLKNLESAIEIYRARHPEASFEITCSPFLLDPLGARSVYQKGYLASRIHDLDHWVTLGEAAGIAFSWDGLTGSTRDAHKLLRFALEGTPTTARSTVFATHSRSPPSVTLIPASPHPKAEVDTAASTTSPQSRGPALQLRLLHALFKAHHEGPGDISDRGFLASTAASATGFASSEIAAVLESEAWGRAVDGLFAEVSRRGRGLAVNAVPTLIINDKYVIGGAQRVGFLVDEFERIRLVGGGEGKGKGKGDGEEGGGDGHGVEKRGEGRGRAVTMGGMLES